MAKGKAEGKEKEKEKENKKENKKEKEKENKKEKESNGPSQDEIRQESSKAAEKALAAQQKADELKEAAHGAADADERQKLMEQAIDKQVEAESLGKTAKYMRGGAFQGMCVGAGVGTAPGLTLGTLTGTIVGGLTSTILGGLGAGVGSVVGWAHGPFWNVGEVIGKGVRKVTGDLPSWKASDAQKKKLEEMIAQANGEEMPGAKELKSMVTDGWDGVKHQGKAWYQTGASCMPGNRHTKTRAQQDDDPVRASPDAVESVKQAGTSPSRTTQQSTQQPSCRPDERRSSTATTTANAHSPQRPPTRKQPRKLERRSGEAGQTTKSTPKATPTEPCKPRKLEVRS